MERLWAPWRVEYVTADEPKPGTCIFCDALGQEDGVQMVLSRNEHTFTIMNRFPYSNGHVMVVPNRHVASLSLLSDDEQAQIMHQTSVVVEVLKEAMGCDGYNIGMNLGRAAGAGIDQHLHQHVVPRWSGDTNFVTVVGDIRVIPEAIRATHEKLLAAYSQIGQAS
jgi:ATP adenylyltransferase